MAGKGGDLQMLLETKDLLLKKAEFEDWKAMYRNVWSRPETAKYMAWRVTTSEEDARVRIQKTIKYQENHDTYLVYEKKSGQAIGFAGVEEIAPHIYQDASVALGPEYVGKGFGKQILRLLLEYCRSLGGKEFYYSTRANNEASKALALSCGFIYRCAEKKTDLRNGEPYEVETYHKEM
ncbi:GNAT family N-acetyltransferase [Roseburia hominis]